MAYIRPFAGNRWRAEVFKHGTRKSKVFDNREQAEVWAAALERIASQRHCSVWSMKDRLELAQKVDFTGAALVTGVPRRVIEANASVPFPYTDILGSAIPYEKSSGVYFLIRGNEVTYIGQSLDVLHRIARHRREGRVFDGYAVILCDQHDMDRLEAMYIAAFVPEENVSLGNLNRRTPSSVRVLRVAFDSTPSGRPRAIDDSSDLSEPPDEENPAA